MNNAFNTVKELSIEPMTRERFGPWALFMVIAVLPFLSMIGYFITSQIAQNHEEQIDEKFMSKLEISSHMKASAIDQFLEQSIDISKRVTNSRVVQNFSGEVNDLAMGESMGESLREQYLYIQEVLTSFATQNNLAGAHLINRRMEAYLTSVSAGGLTENYADFARDVFNLKKPVYSPLRMDGEIMLMDVYVPITAMQSLEMNPDEMVNRVVGVLVMSMSVKERLQNLMKPNLNTLEGESLHLFQEVSGGVEMVRFGQEDEGIFAQNKDAKAKDDYKKVWEIYMLREDGKYDLSKIPQFGSQTPILPRSGEIIMTKTRVKNIPIVVMGVIELREAYSNLVMQRKQIFIIGQLCAFIAFIFVLALWWRLQEYKQRTLLKQYQFFNEKIGAQRNLLQTINDSIFSHISLKYFDGKYVYANRALLEFFNLKETDVIGLTDAKLFGTSVAAELAELDKKLLKEKQRLFVEKSYIVNDKRYYFEISKIPFLDGNNRFVGITTIIKDITEIVQERQMREKAMQNSIRSMMRIMERHDYHLVRHAKNLSRIVVEFAKHNNLKRRDLMTLELAAKLSQVGKIYVPLDILLREGTELNDHDLLTYQTHIEDTAYILDTVDWGLPVVKVVYAMHEKLNGTGYPNGLKSDEISHLSRVLSVCETFCVLTSPRRGVKVYTPEEAIKFMVNDKGAYDLSIIQSLAEMISENEGLVLAS